MPPADDYYAEESAAASMRLPKLAGAAALALAITAVVVGAGAGDDAGTTLAAAAKSGDSLKSLQAQIIADRPATTEDFHALKSDFAAQRRELLGKLAELQAELAEHDRILKHRGAAFAGHQSAPESPAPPVVRDDEAMLDK